jgi:DNA invertase Pin-like site-specific DNA recombinase
MDAARKRQIDCVVVWKLDRWGRTMLHAIESIQDLAAHGVRWVAITQGLDTHQTNPMARAMLGMLAVFAEFEREMIRERVIAGIRTAKARGVHCGRHAKIFNGDEALQMREQGMSVRQIAKRFRVGQMCMWRRLRRAAAGAAEQQPDNAKKT